MEGQRLRSFKEAKEKLKGERSSTRRQRKFVALEPDDDQWELGCSILEEVKMPQGASVYDRFVELEGKVRARGLHQRCPHFPQDPQERMNCRCTTIVYFIGQTSATLAPGSVVTYLRHVETWAKASGRPFKGPEYRALKEADKAVRLRASVARARGAKPLTLIEARGAIAAVEKIDPIASAMLYLIAATGQRPVDLQSVLHTDFGQGRGTKEGFLMLQIVRGKTIGRPQDRHMVSEDLTKTGLVMPPLLQQIMNGLERGRHWFSQHGAVVLNQRLEEAVGKKVCTTYSFRKMYAVRKFVETDGDFQLISRYMGHKDLRMAQAFYIGPYVLDYVVDYETIFNKCIDRRRFEIGPNEPLEDEEEVDDVTPPAAE